MKTEKEKQLLIEQLKKTPIIQIACEKARIARASFYRWKNEDKEFAKLAEEALLEGETFITEMSESQLISMIRNGNFQAVQLWLRHHHPSYTNKVEITGNIKHSDEELTPEQAALVKAALRLASFDKNHGEEK
jgi:hypothetical protein